MLAMFSRWHKLYHNDFLKYLSLERGIFFSFRKQRCVVVHPGLFNGDIRHKYLNTRWKMSHSSRNPSYEYILHSNSDSSDSILYMMPEEGN